VKYYNLSCRPRRHVKTHIYIRQTQGHIKSDFLRLHTYAACGVIQTVRCSGSTVIGSEVAVHTAARHKSS
jgi:hypothetical protein